MYKLDIIVSEHMRWIKEGMPIDVVPQVNYINEIRQSIHNVIKKMMRIPVKKKVRVRDFLWEQAIIIDGLIVYYEDSKNKDIFKAIRDYYQGILSKKNKGYTIFTLTDQIMHGRNILWLIDNGYTEFQCLIDEATNFIKTNKNEQGFLSYSQNNKNVIYVDALGMICPFCVKYGNDEDRELFEIGIRQLLFHIRNVTDEKEMPYHAYNLSTNEVLGSSSWGRGLGWMFYGLSGVLSSLRKNDATYDTILTYYIYLCEYVYENFSDGILYNDYCLKDHVDTSAVSMIAASIAIGLKEKLLPIKYYDFIEQAVGIIEKNISEDGNVLSCSRDCLGINNTSKEYTRFCAGGPSIKLLSLFKQIKNN